MLRFERTKIVQAWSPLFVFPEIFGDVFGEKNMTGVAAIHHSLSNVKTRASEIGSFIYIDHAADWPAVDSHPKLQARMFLERAADLHCALHRRFRIRVKDQRNAVAGWNFNQAIHRFGSLKLLGCADNLV